MDYKLPISSVSHTVPSILSAFKGVIRLERSVWAGGHKYSKALYTMDNERICNTCAREQWPDICRDTINGYGQWQAGYIEVYWEGPPQHCLECNEPQHSEYGDPCEDITPAQSIGLYRLAARVIETYNILMNCDGCSDGLPVFTSMKAHELTGLFASLSSQATEVLDPNYRG